MNAKKVPDLGLHYGVLSRMGLLEGLLQIAREHSVLLDDVLAPGKSQSLVRARVACYRFLRDKGMSYPEIGRVMLRDHTTVLQTLRNHERGDDDSQAAGD